VLTAVADAAKVGEVSSFAPPEVPQPYGPAQEPPGWLTDIVDVVLRDLQRPQPLEIRIGWTPGVSEVEGMLWFQEAGDPSITGVSVPRADATYLTVHLADQLQEQFFPETSGAWGQARPTCPGHTHPAEADLRESVAWWICPESRQPLWRLGEAMS
jgi:hypothetical protein